MDKEIEAGEVRGDSEKLRTSSMAAAETDQMQPKVRAAWRPVFGGSRGK